MSWHGDDWKKIDKPTAKAIIELCGLQGITWSTLDSRWYFQPDEWDAMRKSMERQFPGKNPVMIHSFQSDEVWVSPIVFKSDE